MGGPRGPRAPQRSAADPGSPVGVPGNGAAGVFDALESPQ